MRSSRACAANGRTSIEQLLAITRQQTLLDDNPLLARSIRNRFPYLDPLNHLQIELLKRHRAGDADEQRRAGHPPVDQRHRGGPAQQRLNPATELQKPGFSGSVYERRAWATVNKESGGSKKGAPATAKLIPDTLRPGSALD